MTLKLAFGDFEIDEARFELRRSGEAVAVQPKVLDLIVYLVRHRDRVVTKDELLETVWQGVSVTEASLSQAVSLARRALDDTPEAMHTIRTVRSKGLQFVAECHEPARHTPTPPARSASPVVVKPRVPRVSTMMETAQEDAPRALLHGEAPHLFAVLHCENPEAGGASWSLADIDEVRLVRGSERRTEREAGELTRALTLTLPGRLLSRQHARIVRTQTEWVVVDDGSRNGTFVNGQRIDKRPLIPGDVVECGRTLIRFTSEPRAADVGPDADSRTMAGAALPTVTPRLAALARDLERIAPSELPILLVGESGVGKTHAAHALHRLSGRSGPMVTIDVATISSADAICGGSGSAAERARHGTLLLENLQRAEPHVLGRLASALESVGDARLMCTAIGPTQELERRVPAELLTRLSGFRCEIPPLRDRPGDLGVLVGCLLQAAGHPGPEIDVTAGRALLRHSWPGNLRELARTLQVGATLSGGSSISVEHLPTEMRAQPA